jgi:hypothetical protein
MDSLSPIQGNQWHVIPTVELESFVGVFDRHATFLENADTREPN